MRRSNPYAFTEHGVVMAANIVSSKVAIDAGIVLVKSFVKMRIMLSEHIDLKRRLAQGFAQHEHELRETRFLIAQPETPTGRPKQGIGF